MKREVIFDVPDNSGYRIVCRFGYNSYVKYNWYCHLQKKEHYRKWLLFGDYSYRWVEVDRCWFSSTMESMDHLKKRSLAFYDEVILLPKRIQEHNMNL